MEKVKRIALVAHDNMKRDLAEWVRYNWETLVRHKLVCTGTTGKMVHETILDEAGSLAPQSFFWDPMSPQPHDVDVKALLRIAVLYNIPMACNRSSADFLISSTLFDQEYEQQVRDYGTYLSRTLP
jgi:methylglyoxal synthase